MVENVSMHRVSYISCTKVEMASLRVNNEGKKQRYPDLIGCFIN
jgi:hypothetical protein